MGKKIIGKILNCDSAMSEIIGVIMLLAIAVSMIALIQTQSVPEWNKAVERDHSSVLYDDYLKLKSDIDDTALFQFSRSSIIHMGAHYPERLIFRNPPDTTGMLTSKNDNWIRVDYTPFNGTPASFNITTASIIFQPNYNYYTEPLIIYEHGLVIKNFSADNYLYTDSDQTIFTDDTINIIGLNFSEGSESFSGIKTLNFFPQSANSSMNNTDVTVTLYTNYPLLWNELLKKYNLNYIVSGNILEIDYTDQTMINLYTVNGSIASGTGVYTITPVPTTPTPTPTPAPGAIRGVSLTNITGMSQTTPKGNYTTYILNLTNNGTDTDSYTLSISNPDLASVAVLNVSSPVVLNAGQTRIFTLNVTNTSAGGPFRVNVTATSINDITKSGSINSSTTVSPLTVTAFLRSTSATPVSPEIDHIFWDIGTNAGTSASSSTHIDLTESDNVNYAFHPGQGNSHTGTPDSSYTGYGWAGVTPVNGTIGGIWSFQVKTISETNSGNGTILIYVYKYDAATKTATYLFHMDGTYNHLGTTSGTIEQIGDSTPYYSFDANDYLIVEYWLKVTTTTHDDDLHFEVNTNNEFLSYLQK